MQEFSNEFMVQRESIEFLTPYFKQIEPTVQQTPIQDPDFILERLELETKLEAINSSTILETSEMRKQVLEELNNIFPTIKNLKKLYSTNNFGEIDIEKFHASCIDHEITLSLAKSNFNKVIGLLFPKNWNSLEDLTSIAFGSTSIIYFDDQKIRICN